MTDGGLMGDLKRGVNIDTFIITCGGITPYRKVVKKMHRKEKIGELLKTCRERAGFTQREMAERLYLERSTISKIETNVLPPSYTLVKEWARLTNAQEMVGIDLTGGRDGWKKLTALENAIKQVKSTMDLVNFRKRKENGNAAAAQVRSRL